MPSDPKLDAWRSSLAPAVQETRAAVSGQSRLRFTEGKGQPCSKHAAGADRRTSQRQPPIERAAESSPPNCPLQPRASPLITPPAHQVCASVSRPGKSHCGGFNVVLFRKKHALRCKCKACTLWMQLKSNLSKAMQKL